MASNQEIHWFVARTRSRQEKKIRQIVEEMGIEVYLPVREEMRQWHDRRKKVEVVLIPSIIFIRTDKTTALSLPNDKGLPIRYAINTTLPRHEIMTVPHREMENFIKSLSNNEEEFHVENDLIYLPGTKVRITNGPMAGIEGELVRVDNKKKVIVRLTGIIACSLEIPMSRLERIKE
jgi:transcription antitermination factor NusG